MLINIKNPLAYRFRNESYAADFWFSFDPLKFSIDIMTLLRRDFFYIIHQSKLKEEYIKNNNDHYSDLLHFALYFDDDILEILTTYHPDFEFMIDF